MSDRTAEQIAADDALEAAILAVLRVYNLLEEGRALGDFLVLTALPGYSDDKNKTTEYHYIMPGEGIPWHQINGLMYTHRRLMDEEMLGRESDK